MVKRSMPPIEVIANFCRSMDDEFTYFDIVTEVCGYYSKSNAAWLFSTYWRSFPRQYLYELYKQNLSVCECGNYYNRFFKTDLLDEISKLNKHDTVNNITLKTLLDDNGYLTVYHGHSKRTLHNSNSWTTDREVAVFFGNRNAYFYNRNDYYIATGKISLDNMIAYIDERNEAEVVVLQKYVKSKTKEFFKRDDTYTRPTKQEEAIKILDSIKQY